MPTSLLWAATGTKDGATASSAAENANHVPGALLWTPPSSEKWAEFSYSKSPMIDYKQ